MLARSRHTQLAMDDAARESLVDTMSCSEAAVFHEEFETMPVPAAAPPVMVASAAKPKAARMRGVVMFDAASKPMVERQATIRYYSQMAPERMFPLLVVISRKAIMEVVKR